MQPINNSMTQTNAENKTERPPYVHKPSIRERILNAESLDEAKTLADETETYKMMSAKTARRVQRAIFKRTHELKSGREVSNKEAIEAVRRAEQSRMHKEAA